MNQTRQQFREAMARLGAAVNVVTTDGEAGRAGFTASAVCSVTDDPPTLLVCMNRSSENNAIFKSNGVLCVNVLAARQQNLANTFAGLTGLRGAARFDEAVWSKLATGAPVLDGAVAAVDCEVEEVLEKGTHSVLFGAVRAVRLGVAGSALIWWARDYREIESPAA